jgi:nicotinate-nucleotide pyrophosphorylase (carboxylating)
MSSSSSASSSLFQGPEFAATVQADVTRALAEDVRSGDLTAALVPPRFAHARVLAREAAVVCGRPWVEAAFARVVPQGRLTWHVAEGQPCVPNQVVFELAGPAPELLTVERTALNFLQLLSGVATRTAQFVQAVAGTRAHIVDTRKTLPGLRVAQKYAVSMGGGVNHRMGLFDAILIKENHIAAAGGVSAVLAQAQAVAAQAKFVEIEVEHLWQLRQALDAGAQMILLDNMSIPTLHEAVAMNQGRAVLEISGGVTLASVRALAETGVDRISIGGLTKDVTATDYSMRFDGL